MCCRYLFDDETIAELERISGDGRSAASFQVGEMHPADAAPVLTGRNGRFFTEEMRWGFPARPSGRLLINARSESVYEKPTFADSIRSRRCILAAREFYEWDRAKQIAAFSAMDRSVLFMAGIFRSFADGWRFTILTRQANDSVRPVHDRMPVILRREELDDWLFEPKKTRELLNRESILLDRCQAYEQLSLPF